MQPQNDDEDPQLPPPSLISTLEHTPETRNSTTQWRTGKLNCSSPTRPMTGTRRASRTTDDLPHLDAPKETSSHPRYYDTNSSPRGLVSETLEALTLDSEEEKRERIRDKLFKKRGQKRVLQAKR